jgi:DNA-binding MarR family transcriptional regulator
MPAGGRLRPDRLFTTTIVVVNNNMIAYDAATRHPRDAVHNKRGRRRMSDRRLAASRAAASGARGATRGRARAAIDLGALDRHLGYFIRRLQVWVFQDFIRTLAPIDIRPAQYSVLVVIAANPGLSQADLAHTLGIERARLVRLLDRLERRGLTRRLPSRADRRSHALRLTRNGRKTLERARALAAVHEAHLDERLGPERRRAMIEALRRFEG